MWFLLTKRSASRAICGSSSSASARQFGEVADEARVALAVEAVEAGEFEHEQGERAQLGGEGLGRGDADLRTGARHQHEVGLAHEARLRHVADGEGAEVAAPAPFAQGGQGVGGFAGLRDRHEQRIGRHHRMAIAVFAGHLDAAGDVGEAFQPVAGDEAGVVAGAAGDDLHVAHALEQILGVDAEDVRQDAALGDAALERLGDRARLLEDLLQHVMAVFAAFDRIGRQFAGVQAALDRRAVGIVHLHGRARDLDDVAFVEVDELVCHLDQRLHVGTEEVFADADADAERAAAARADHMAGLVAADDGDRIGAVQAADRLLHGLAQVMALLHEVVDEVGDHLGVGVRIEAVAGGLEFAAQAGVVLDDAVVDHADRAGGQVRMRVRLVRHAMGGPARVGDAGGAGQRRGLDAGLEFAHLAGGTRPGEFAFGDHREAG